MPRQAPSPPRASAGRPPGEAVFRLLVDCPSCRVHSAMVEVVACRGSDIQAMEATCRLCGRREKTGRCVRAGAPMTTPAQARALLEMWASREGEPDSSRFVAHSFLGLEANAVVGRLVNGAEVQTSFEPLDWLVPESMAGHGGRPPTGATQKAMHSPRYQPVLPRPAGAQPAPSRRTAVRALASAVAGGGVVRPAARTFLDRLLVAAKKEALADGEARLWHPFEPAVPEALGRLLEGMACLAEVNRRRDSSGWRVVAEFARAWTFSLTRLEARAAELGPWRGPGQVRLWYALRDLLAAEKG